MGAKSRTSRWRQWLAAYIIGCYGFWPVYFLMSLAAGYNLLENYVQRRADGPPGLGRSTDTLFVIFIVASPVSVPAILIPLGLFLYACGGWGPGPGFGLLDLLVFWSPLFISLFISFCLVRGACWLRRTGKKE